MTTPKNVNTKAMKKFFVGFGQNAIKLSLVAAVVLVLTISAMAQTLVVNPYEQVDWQSFEQHKANLHTHTTQSDGELTPSQAIDEYRSRGYTILALTDHNLCTWPWTGLAAMERKGKALQSDNAAAKGADATEKQREMQRVFAYEDRDPQALGMVAVPGNEFSIHHHANGFFVAHENRSRELEQTIKEVDELGGLVMINHPGRYWEPADDGSIPDEVVERYVALFREFSNTVGIEVINQGQRYKHDVRLWDKVLAALMPDRAVWGFSNDDMHAKRKLGRDWNVFVIDELNESSVRAAMEAGQFYFSTLGTHPEEERSVAETPVITAVSHDGDAGVITITAMSGGAPLPEDRYRWISNGRVIETGPRLAYKGRTELGDYARAELTGNGGTTFTNPMGFESDK